jgi:putative FmdB family regulatory protein
MPHHWHSKSESAKPEADVPTYQYACTACGHQLEAVQSFADEPLTECPACEGRLRKVFSSVGIVFKGSGFYRNDSRPKGKDGAETKPAGESKPAAEKSTAEKSSSTSETKSGGDSKSTGGDAKPAAKAAPTPSSA